MGGDKTHLMLFRSDRRRSASLRTQVPNKAGIRAPTTFGDARVVAISGRQPMDHHIWEEIAHQLGKTDAFRRFWENGPTAQQPSMARIQFRSPPSRQTLMVRPGLMKNGGQQRSKAKQVERRRRCSTSTK